jgi:flagellar basal-body rod modification protein FlgD
VNVNGIAGTTAATGATPEGEATELKDPLGRDMFLQLLVTQLQHQDPTQPEDSGEFLAQLAQFTSLESLQGIKSDMAAMRALLEGGSSAAKAASTLVDESTVTNEYVAPGY